MKRGIDSTGDVEDNEVTKKHKHGGGDHSHNNYRSNHRYRNNPISTGNRYFPRFPNGGDSQEMYGFANPMLGAMASSMGAAPFSNGMLSMGLPGPTANQFGGYPAPSAMFQNAGFHPHPLMNVHPVGVNPAMPMGNRTAYIGNLPPETTLEELLNMVHTGSVEHSKILPEKSCAFITFTDAFAAQRFVQECRMTRLVLQGQECRVGFGKPSVTPLNVARALQNGATRSVYVGNIDEAVTKESLSQALSEFGAIDSIKVIPEKKIAFVYMASVASAVKAVQNLSNDAFWGKYRINFGKDRCNPYQQHIPKTFPANSGDFQTPQGRNRTVYLGMLSPDLTTKELCDHVSGGALEKVKYLPEKSIAFVTFVSDEAASSFYQRCQSADGLLMKGKKVKAGWGKPQMKNALVVQALSNGGSRSLYIAYGDKSLPAETIQELLTPFGDIELINMFPEERVAYVSFTEVASAVKALEAMKTNSAFEGTKFGYSKDRCAVAKPPVANSDEHLELSSLLPDDYNVEPMEEAASQ